MVVFVSRLGALPARPISRAIRLPLLRLPRRRSPAGSAGHRTALDSLRKARIWPVNPASSQSRCERLLLMRVVSTLAKWHWDLTGRIIAAWPSFVLTASFKLLTRQIRRSVPGGGSQAPSEAGNGQRPAAGLTKPDVTAQPGPGMGLRRRVDCSVRHGNGRWPTGPVMARCRPEVRPRASMVGANAGAGWSRARTGRGVRGHHS